MKFFVVYFFFVFSCVSLRSTELLIHSIHFSGNTTFSNKQLLNEIYSEEGQPFQQKIANDDSRRIAVFYEKKGFFQAKIFLPEITISEKGEIKMIFRIEENGKTKIDEIKLIGNHYVTSETILAILSSSFMDDVSTILQTIIDYYGAQGFLFAKATVDKVYHENGKNIVQILIDEGNYCRFEDFVFRGNKVTKESTLLKITQLDRAKTVTPELLLMAEENIQKKPYISQADIIPLNHKTALIEIKENNMTFFSAMVGYDNREKQDKRLNGYFNLEFLNLYGTDRTLSFHWQKLNIERTTIELSYHESGVKDIPIGGDFSIFREEVDSTYIATTFETELYWYNIYAKHGIYYSFEDIFPGKIKVIEKTTFQRIGFFSYYQNLDFYLNPHRGIEFYFRYYTIFNKMEESRINKQAIEGLIMQVIPISQNMVLSGKISLQILENKSISQFEYFYLGGHANLRGFMENQFYGFRTGLANFEFRYLMGRYSRFFLFTDYGYVENTDYIFGKLFGFGFGMRISTRLGLLGIDYGFGYQDRLRNPLEGIVHFGIETKL